MGLAVSRPFLRDSGVAPPQQRPPKSSILTGAASFGHGMGMRSGSGARRCRLITPGKPDFDRIRALVEEEPEAAEGRPTLAEPGGQRRPSAPATREPRTTSSPSPTATPDDSDAVDLSATC